MNSKSHVGFWLIVFLVAVFVVPYLVRGEQMRARMVAEVQQVQDVLGENIGRTVVQTATAVYEGTVVASGLRAAMDQFQHTREDKQNARDLGSTLAVAAAEGADSYFDALGVQLYSIILRGTIVATWGLLLLPFAAAVLMDGFYSRAKKFEVLGFQNPTAFAASLHVAVAISAAPLMYIVAPLAITPLFIPWWAVAAALPLSFAIQHMQPVLTR